ncbi:DUF4153 domain-containing protein [Mucilaginibacter sp. UR6-1]|uniref:DUF4153 domain-containing protein n=1 Tax=Mucilaginibacter sp. UR6-1 TaxID=1435643 RepID=UPI001E2FA203|nr:DUF4153 domain-containing protein [Mucilaginibacter sp. UR6-1]MCC8409696.1 DUF4153 domain-containing protein [Mucilaginibacter sp. UR6-1]
MKFPSVKNLAESAAKTAKRFPFELFFALTATIATTVNIELNDIARNAESWCLRLTMMGNLGLLLNLSATLYAEAKGLTKARKLILSVIASGVAIAILFVINPAERESDYTRFFLLSLAFHLMVAYAGFTAKGHIQGFWQFNKTLFLRFLTSALYCVVLGLGISAAIGAVNYLFGVEFEFDTYRIIWTWIVFMFGTIFFLSGVPVGLQALDQDVSYPKGLKVFTQYVLIPLATIYVAILLAYEVKIITQWNLPKGNVGYLIMGYSVFGILSLLLVYPIREQAENKWLKTYARSFYFLMLPLLVLLFVAIGARVFKYGITEFRYFLITLACWLLFITIYFLLFKKQNIKLIPITLSILALLSVYGPQSAYSVSEFSQRSILANIMKRNNSYSDGRFIPVKKISKQDGNRAVAVLEYLVNRHDLTSLQPYFKADLQAVSDSIGKRKSKWNTGFIVNRYELRMNKLTWVKKQLNLNKFSGRYYDGDIVEVNLPFVNYNFTNIDEVLALKGYDYIVDVNAYTDTAGVISRGSDLTIKQQSKAYKYSIWINNELITFDPNELITTLTARYPKKDDEGADTNIEAVTIPASLLTLTEQSKSFEVKLVLSRLSYSYENKKITRIDLSGTYLIKRK